MSNISPQDMKKEFEFLRKLKSNQLSTPNDLTIGIGLRIKKAREETNLSQSELAKILNRRQATISDIENGKSEIGVVTLVQFAVILNKPISFFFPELLLKNWIMDVKSKFQFELLDYAKEIERIGNEKLVKSILNNLLDYFREFDNKSDFYPLVDDEEENS